MKIPVLLLWNALTLASFIGFTTRTLHQPDEMVIKAAQVCIA